MRNIVSTEKIVTTTGAQTGRTTAVIEIVMGSDASGIMKEETIESMIVVEERPQMSRERMVEKENSIQEANHTIKNHRVVIIKIDSNHSVEVRRITKENEIEATHIREEIKTIKKVG